MNQTTLKGLQTAIELLKRNVKVLIRSSQPPIHPATCSSGAGGLWMPYKCDDPRVDRWAMDTLNDLLPLSRRPFLSSASEEKELPDFFWLYNICAWGFSSFFYFLNITFLFVAYNDANRRNAGMQRLSKALEFDFHKKDSISIRFPVINFLESKSLLTWLAARKIILDMGFRFE